MNPLLPFHYLGILHQALRNGYSKMGRSPIQLKYQTILNLPVIVFSVSGNVGSTVSSSNSKYITLANEFNHKRVKNHYFLEKHSSVTIQQIFDIFTTLP